MIKFQYASHITHLPPPPRTPRPRAWYHLEYGKPILKLAAPRLENGGVRLGGRRSM